MPQRTHGPTTGAARPSTTPSADSTESGLAATPRRGVRRTPTKSAIASGKAAPPAHDHVAAAAPEQDAQPLAPELIARTLRAVAGALERDPALARRVAADAGFGAPATAAPLEAAATPTESAQVAHAPLHQRAFRPRLVTGADAALGPGIPDPFALRAARGEAGLCAVLEELRLGTLRAIIRAHHLDPAGRFAQQNDAARLRAAIVEATAGAKPADK